MEERMLDEDELRKVKLKRTAEGGTDAVEDDGSEDVEVDLSASPENLFGEYGDDLVGLTPSQLEEELARRKREKEEAREQSEALTKEGGERLAAGEFGDAALLFSQAISCDGENFDARRGLWTAVTRNFSSADGLYEREEEGEFSAEPGEIRTFVLDKMKKTVEADRAACAAEAEALAPSVEEAQAERREAFRANRKYYALRAGGLFAAFLALAIGCAIAASFIFRTPDLAPVIAAAVLGGAAFVFLAVFAVYAAKWAVARRYCSMNENLSSTEDGARLQALRDREEIIARILGEDEQEDEDASPIE